LCGGHVGSYQFLPTHKRKQDRSRQVQTESVQKRLSSKVFFAFSCWQRGDFGEERDVSWKRILIGSLKRERDETWFF